MAVLSKRGRFAVAEPLFFRGRKLTLDRTDGASAGDLVLVGGGKRGARVVRRLGRPDVARDVLEGLMLDKGLRRRFPREVERDAIEAAARPAMGADARGRRDLTGLTTFTIDPTGARDFDDAISAEREPGGRIRLWVHIADVSAHVRPGTAVEGEAHRRATSVYVPAAVEPMLPEALSNEACSLVPGADRLAVTVELLMDGTDVVSAAFGRSVIRSDARLTYERVDRIFGGSERAEDPWAGALDAARGVAAALRERRDTLGSIVVESVEPSFLFDSAGHVTGVVNEEQTESHRLIEELMILTNEQVAGHLADAGRPTLYRVHENPEPLSVLALADKLASLDIPTPPLPKHPAPAEAARLAGEMSVMVAEHVRRTGRGRQAYPRLVLRSLKQAVYSPRNVGHSGLASKRYCHFTSPIRRYPDLVVHRALLASIGIDDEPPRASELQEAAEWSSDREREAMVVERDADDVCRAFLLERRLFEGGFETEWDGEVVGVIGAGAFIRFGEEGFEGFLPVRRMKGDWYDLNEQETALVGSREGSAFRLGDPARVTVGKVDAPRGRVDLCGSRR